MTREAPQAATKKCISSRPPRWYFMVDDLQVSVRYIDSCLSTSQLHRRALRQELNK